MKQKKEKRITLRVTPEQYETIQAKAETAQMSTGAYVRAAALRHRVVVIDGLREFTHELKGIAAISTSWWCWPIWGRSGRCAWVRPWRHWGGSTTSSGS